MPHGIETRLIERITPMVRDLVTTEARALADLRYADVRVEVTEGKFAGAENGSPKSSGDDYAFAVGIRVLAGSRMIAPGYFGRGLGVADVPELARLLREALRAAYRRAMANAEMKAEIKGKFGALGDALADTRLHPIPVRQEVVPQPGLPVVPAVRSRPCSRLRKRWAVFSGMRQSPRSLRPWRRRAGSSACRSC